MLKSSYKNLQIWEKGIVLVQNIYKMTSTFPPEEKYGLISQLRRSAVSIPSNIAEGSQRGSNKEFSNFILIAKESLAELETQIVIASKLNYTNLQTAHNLALEISELQKMLFSFHNKLKTKN